MDQGLRGRVSLQRTMRLGLSKKTKHELIAGILLFAFAVRALVPQGFMPASDRPFSIEICPSTVFSAAAAPVGQCRICRRSSLYRSFATCPPRSSFRRRLPSNSSISHKLADLLPPPKRIFFGWI
jgi:hypothetical protein